MNREYQPDDLDWHRDVVEGSFDGYGSLSLEELYQAIKGRMIEEAVKELPREPERGYERELEALEDGIEKCPQESGMAPRVFRETMKALLLIEGQCMLLSLRLKGDDANRVNHIRQQTKKAVKCLESVSQG